MMYNFEEIRKLEEKYVGHPLIGTSTVRLNLMTERNYSPYCGKPCSAMPRTYWDHDLKQFKCSCGWVTSFPDDFIKLYRAQWNK